MRLQSQLLVVMLLLRLEQPLAEEKGKETR